MICLNNLKILTIIRGGDIAIIDRSLECQNGDFVATYVDGEFTLKQFKLDETNNCAWLIPV